jgi:hypothetical protein
MKHEQEKSDLFIVAMKPANKPGRLGAELVEPRERTEGNTGEQYTRRTLRRVSVSQRLDHVRGAACELLRYPFRVRIMRLSTLSYETSKPTTRHLRYVMLPNPRVKS